MLVSLTYSRTFINSPCYQCIYVNPRAPTHFVVKSFGLSKSKPWEIAPSFYCVTWRHCSILIMLRTWFFDSMSWKRNLPDIVMVIYYGTWNAMQMAVCAVYNAEMKTTICLHVAAASSTAVVLQHGPSGFQLWVSCQTVVQ